MIYDCKKATPTNKLATQHLLVSPMNHWLRWWCGTLITTRLENESMNSRIPLGVALKIFFFSTPLKFHIGFPTNKKIIILHHVILFIYWGGLHLNFSSGFWWPPSHGDFHPRPGGFGESLPASSGGTHFVWQGKLRNPPRKRRWETSWVISDLGLSDQWSPKHTPQHDGVLPGISLGSLSRSSGITVRWLLWK